MGDEDSELHFLHGNLIINIVEARDLPDTDSAFWKSSKNVTDAFARVRLFPFGVKLAETKVVYNSLFPVWNEEFHVLACHDADYIRVDVLDFDNYFSGGDHVGYVNIPVQRLLEEGQVFDWFDLQCNEDGEGEGAINISVRFNNKCDDKHEKFLSEKNYYDIRHHNKMVLYQDADTPQLDIFQGVSNPDGSDYVTTRCWRDTYDLIENAEKLIYIVGWSVDTSKSLLRGEEDPDGSLSNIGQLLIRKAEEGVRVLVMIWNDRSSGALSRGGQMGTHDEITEEFFSDTPVQVANLPRVKDDVGIIKSEIVKAVYTHHQKFVLADAEDSSSGLRRLVAFLGGIDLTDGRFEDCQYKLFDYADTHGEDFYQNCTPGATAATGPREPWHDIHSRLEGPITLDILDNFETRWRKQASDKIGSLYEITEDEFNIDFIPEVDDTDGGHWNIQLLRSITSDSCEFDVDKLDKLTSKAGFMLEDSIQRAYIHQIRQAEHFIYIENQYFLGSAFDWTRDQTTSSKHTVPKEIVSRIVEKIEAGERFTVYVVIPLFPEGDPTSQASQEILYWQHATIESMYKRIGRALWQAGLDNHPTDYLMFFAPCKSESSEQVPEDMEEPEPDTPAALCRASLRHPIYVHSKMMIVDDDFIIVGSANINQRSMAGSRDSEIAVGASQVDHQSDDHDGQPRGKIHTFRLALWSCLLGGYREEFKSPSSQECLDLVREISNQYQEQYISDSAEFSEVKLLSYPFTVSDEGEVESLPGWEVFPDTEASVFGSKTNLPPDTNTITT